MVQPEVTGVTGVTLAANRLFRPEALRGQVAVEVVEPAHKEEVGHGSIP